MSERVEVSLEVNGARCEVNVANDEPLVYPLRNQLGCRTVRVGCGLEQCGACTVLVAGEPVLSCVRATSEFAGRSIRTLEGCVGDPLADRLRAAFAKHRAAQCGYCTAGILLALLALLRRSPGASDAAIVAALDTHICRCGAHAGVLRASREVRDELASSAGSSPARPVIRAAAGAGNSGDGP